MKRPGRFDAGSLAMSKMFENLEGDLKTFLNNKNENALYYRHS